MFCILILLGDAVVLTEVEFGWAMKDFKPTALRDVALMVPGSLGWSDIGGLHDVRKVLEQTLLWPIKVITVKTYKICDLN